MTFAPNVIPGRNLLPVARRDKRESPWPSARPAPLRLADGREITVAQDFRKADAAGDFLRRVRNQSCRVFRVTLSPDFNADHHDHFHLDMGPWGQCR